MGCFTPFVGGPTCMAFWLCSEAWTNQDSPPIFPRNYWWHHLLGLLPEINVVRIIMQCPHHPFNQNTYWWLSYITGFLQGSIKNEPLKNLPNLKGCLSHAMNPSWTCDRFMYQTQQPEPASSARLPGVFVAPSGRIGRSWAGFSVRQKFVGSSELRRKERCRDSSHGNLGAFWGEIFVVRKSLGNILGFFSKDLTRPSSLKWWKVKKTQPEIGEIMGVKHTCHGLLGYNICD